MLGVTVVVVNKKKMLCHVFHDSVVLQKEKRGVEWFVRDKAGWMVKGGTEQ